MFGKLVGMLSFPVRREMSIFIFSMLMSWTIAIVAMISISRNTIYASTFVHLLLISLSEAYVVCLVAWLLSFIRLGWLVRSFVAAVMCMELFVLYFNHSLLSVSVIRLLVETDTRESSEFLTAVLGHHALWITLIIFCIYVMASLWLSRKVKTWTKRTTVMLMLQVIISASVLVGAVLYRGVYRSMLQCLCLDNIDDFGSLNMPRQTTPLTRLFYGVVFNRVATKELDALVKTVEATEVKGCSFRSPLIMLIIGESYNKHHASLYNSEHRETTPRMKALSDEGLLWVFNDVVSPYNLTSDVFREMFSTWDERDVDDWHSHTLFPAVFRKAGYDVHFYSNQFILRNEDLTGEAKHDVVGGTIFNHSKLSDLQFTGRNNSTTRYDGDFISRMPPLGGKKSNRPTLLIVHLIGQHCWYDERYPKEFAHFTPADYTPRYGGKEEQKIHAAYDNATLYNDSIVSSLMQRYRDEEIIAIYVSDHGEECYDWRNGFLRTHDPAMPWGEIHNQYEVPFVVYMSKIYQEKHPEIAEAVKMAVDRPFMNTHLCHMLFGLAGIETVEYKEQLDLLSPQYVPSRRMINGSRDYDAMRRNSAKYNSEY